MTEKGKLVYDFIKVYTRLHSVSPSYDVIAKGIGLSSKSNIHRIIHKLKEQGHLENRPYKFRSVVLKDRSVKEIGKL